MRVPLMAAVAETFAMKFLWNKWKAAANKTKHGVTFEEAITAFRDPLLITINDPDHSEDEPRSILIGLSSRGRLPVVSHTDLDRVRIISARLATRRERRDYEEEEG